MFQKKKQKKKYIDAGNDDWSKVLDENPLPDSYDVIIDTDKISEDDYDNFKSDVMKNIKNCSQVATPTIFRK